MDTGETVIRHDWISLDGTITAEGKAYFRECPSLLTRHHNSDMLIVMWAPITRLTEHTALELPATQNLVKVSSKVDSARESSVIIIVALSSKLLAGQIAVLTGQKKRKVH